MTESRQARHKARGRAGVEAEPDMIAVRMTREAAASLAKACQWGKFRAMDVLENDDAKAHDVARARVAYEWLDWGSSWMTNEEAYR